MLNVNSTSIWEKERMKMRKGKKKRKNKNERENKFYNIFKYYISKFF